jgi:hypothetical protein
MSPRRAAAALLAAALALPAPGPARAATKVEGEYQLMLDLRKSQRVFPWDWESNSYDNANNAQIRIFSQPKAGTEAFVKFEADWSPNDNNAPRPEFQYREAHVRLRRESGPRGIDAYLFSRQDRFWVENYLIPFVSGRGTAQGVRVDAWGVFGMYGALVVADQSDQFNPTQFPADVPRDTAAAAAALRTDDIYHLRLRREFFADRRLRLGLTYNRYEENQLLQGAGETAHNLVLGFDSRYRIGATDLSLEYGESRSPDSPIRYPDQLGREITVFKRSTGIALSDHAVLQAEVRSLRLGTAKAGYIAVTPGYWTRGARWRNSVGGPGADETGFNLNAYYLLPERAITLTSNLRWYSKRANERYENRELYNEVYVEFVNGFTGKSYYRGTDVYRTTSGVRTRERYQDWFNELQVESRLAWLRVQSKVLSIGRPERKQVFAVETRLNLTNTVKIYNRFGLGNDPSILRKGVFTQLQYRPTGSVEMFLQYGPDYIGGGAVPVDEGNLQSGGDQADIVKFILKGVF